MWKSLAVAHNTNKSFQCIFLGSDLNHPLFSGNRHIFHSVIIIQGDSGHQQNEPHGVPISITRGEKRMRLVSSEDWHLTLYKSISNYISMTLEYFIHIKSCICILNCALSLHQCFISVCKGTKPRWDTLVTANQGQPIHQARKIGDWPFALLDHRSIIIIRHKYKTQSVIHHHYVRVSWCE